MSLLVVSNACTATKPRPNAFYPSLHLRSIPRLHNPPCKIASTQSWPPGLRGKFNKLCKCRNGWYCRGGDGGVSESGRGCDGRVSQIATCCQWTLKYYEHSGRTWKNRHPGNIWIGWEPYILEPWAGYSRDCVTMDEPPPALITCALHNRRLSWTHQLVCQDTYQGLI